MLRAEQVAALKGNPCEAQPWLSAAFLGGNWLTRIVATKGRAVMVHLEDGNSQSAHSSSLTVVNWRRQLVGWPLCLSQVTAISGLIMAS